MKLLFCPFCRDALGLLGQVWRQCVCGASGGQYNADLLTATLGGRARVFGVGNPFFDELYLRLNEEQKKQLRLEVYRQFTDAWWGEFPGDVQIFRIDSPQGPRLKIRMVAIPHDAKSHQVIVVDKRPFTIDGSANTKEVIVPINLAPFKRQLIKPKGGPNKSRRRKR